MARGDRTKKSKDGEKQKRSLSFSSFSTMMHWVKSLVLLLGVIFYLFIGAAIFRTLERPSSVRAASKFETALEQFGVDFECLGEDGVTELLNIVHVAISEGAYDEGRPYAEKLMEGNDSFTQEVWTFGGSFVFSYTVVTTIGYGALAPRTEIGQYVCIVYAVIGIPLMGFILLTVGELMALQRRWRTRLLDRFCKRLVTASHLRTTLIIINSSIIISTIIVLAWSVIQMCTQEWNFVTSFYCAIITLSTIGFGDFIPEYWHTSAIVMWSAKIASIILLIIGLGSISMTLTVITKKQQLAGRRVVKGFSMTKKQLVGQFSLTVRQSALWTRLQYHFQRGDDALHEEDNNSDNYQNVEGTRRVSENDGSDDVDGNAERRVSAAKIRWSRIRMSVDYNDDMHNALAKVRQMHIERQRRRSSDKDCEEKGQGCVALMTKKYSTSDDPVIEEPE